MATTGKGQSASLGLDTPERQSWQPGNALWHREVEMLRMAEVGEQLSISEGPFDPPAMKAWGRERTIRAAVLRQLIADPLWPVHAKGVMLRGLRISGRLDLEAATLRCPLHLQACYFDDPGSIILNFATGSIFEITGCCLAGLAGEGLTVTKNLDLTGTTFTGQLLLSSADIGGSLDCSGAQLNVSEDDNYALAANGIKVGGAVFLGEGFTAAGAIDLTAADISYNLTCCNVGRLNGVNNDGNALVADAARIGGHVLLDERFTAAGGIYLVDATIDGFLGCSGAQLGANHDGYAVAASRMKAGNIALDTWVNEDGTVWQPFTAAGTVQLDGADISGSMVCSGAQLKAAPDGTAARKAGDALGAYQLKVGGNVLLETWVNEAGTVRLPFTADGAVRLDDADIGGGLSCAGAQLGANHDGYALAATRMKAGNIALNTWVNEAGTVRQPFTADGAVRLDDADIGGFLDCSGAKLAAGPEGTAARKDGNALAAERMKSGSDVSLDALTATGALRLAGADIGGFLSCSGAHLNGTDADGNALVAYAVKAGDDVLLDNGFTAAGAVRLDDADIGGRLSCSGAQLGANHDGDALAATRMKAGNIALDTWVNADGTVRQLFTAAGVVWLDGADIGGGLSCRGAQLTAAGSNGDALAAYRMKVGGDVLLDTWIHAAGTVWHPFTAAGAVRLDSADIGGFLSCTGARLTAANKDGNALAAYRMKVGGDVLLDTWIHAAGTVRLPFTAADTVYLTDAEIGGSLICTGAQLTATRTSSNALAAERIRADDVSLNGLVMANDILRPFTADGPVLLRSAHIDGSLSLRGTKLSAGKGAMALDASGAQIGHALRWAPREQIAGVVSLEDAQVAQLDDDWASHGEGRSPGNGYWPRADQGLLRLNGFNYAELPQDKDAATLEQRLGWIGSQPAGEIKNIVSAMARPREAWQQRRDRKDWRSKRKVHDFATQPYGHLASVYQRAGHDTEARTVAIARRRDLRLYGRITRRRYAGNWLLDKSIQYGYQTWRAIVGIAVLYIIVLAVFWSAQHQAGLIVPVQSTTGLPAIPTASSCTKYYPCFYPVGYAIDTVIPLVNVHQADYWGPNAQAPFGWVYVSVTWVGIIFGWAFATLAVAGYTGLVRSSDAL